MKSIFRYITIAAALLATAVNAGAQYNYAGGVGTSKTVTQNDAESYTIRLETFATGSTTVTESSTPVDVVLVLDVSGSMNDNGKITKLKNAVNTFIETIQENDLYIVERDAQGNVTKKTRRVDKDNNPISLGNQISIVKFAEPTYYSSESGWVLGRTTTASTTPGNHFPAYTEIWREYYYRDYNTNYSATARWDGRNYTRYNATEVLEGFTATASDSNVSSLKASVSSMIAAGSTAADYGLNLARLLLAGSDVNPEANKVVVFFTDGSPTHSSDFSNTVANSAITYAKAIKDSGATIFSIGVFDSTPATNGNIWRYMNYVSSNYPNATDISTSGSGGDSTKKYYQDASSSSADLTAIFKSIAEGIGGSEEEIGSSTQVRDVVTNSFVLPDNVTAADVHVYTSAATGDASGADDKNPASWATPVEITSSVTPTIVNVDADGNPTSDATKAKNKALFVEGFEYSKDDTSEGAGDGNWVGPRFKNNKWFWAGKKLIIEFKVKANPEATGGETLTNTGKSGVYLKDEEGNYNCINYYEQPHKTLTVNIKIRKTGLRHGESATFELMRIRPKGWDESKTPEENIPNIEYNLIGKPVPGTKTVSGTPEQSADMSDYYKELGWKGFKKIILTNKGADGAEVVKDVLVLDPYWVYMVLEDDWGWAYTMTGDTNQVGDDGTYTTSSVEVNPFRFHNEEKTDAVKHAEAIRINHFKSSERDAKVEHTKSSKVESFTTSK